MTYPFNPRVCFTKSRLQGGATRRIRRCQFLASFLAGLVVEKSFQHNSHQATQTAWPMFQFDPSHTGHSGDVNDPQISK